MNPPDVVQYEKRPLSHRAAGGFLDREAVDDRLQLRSPADDGAFRRAVLSCLVIGDPQNLRPRLALDQIDRAAKDEPAVDRDRILEARRIVSRLPGQAERELEEAAAPIRHSSQADRPTRGDRFACSRFRPARRDRSPAQGARSIPPRCASSVSSSVFRTRSL